MPEIKMNISPAEYLAACNSDEKSELLTLLASDDLPEMAELKKLKERNREEMDAVVDACCWYYDMSRSQVMEKTRKRPNVAVRQMAMYLMRMIYNIRVIIIALYFNCDHSTVTHSVKTITGQLTYDNELQRSKQFIEARIKQHQSCEK